MLSVDAYTPHDGYICVHEYGIRPSKQEGVASNHVSKIKKKFTYAKIM